MICAFVGMGGQWGAEGSSGSDAFRRALILLSEKWRHFGGQSPFLPAAPWAGETTAGASGSSFWKDAPEFPSLKPVEMRREWGEGMGSPLMLGRGVSCRGRRDLVRGHVPCVRDSCFPPGETGPGEGHSGVGTVAVTPSRAGAANVPRVRCCSFTCMGQPTLSLWERVLVASPCSRRGH